MWGGEEKEEAYRWLLENGEGWKELRGGKERSTNTQLDRGM